MSHIRSARLQRCVVCEKHVTISSITTPHQEAPEMLSLSPTAWFGFIRPNTLADADATEFGEPVRGSDLRMILTCSRECVERLLNH